MSSGTDDFEDDIKDIDDSEEEIDSPKQREKAAESPRAQEVVLSANAAANTPSAEQSGVAPGTRDTPKSDSKFFAIRTTGGQERIVASTLQTRINSKKVGIRSILVLDSFKGYIIVEAPDSNVAYEALAGVRHVRGQIRGDLPFKDIEGYLIKKPVVAELNVDDTVEIIAGPFKAMKAKITRVDYDKQEATVLLLDSPYQIPVTVDANYLKKAAA